MDRNDITWRGIFAVLVTPFSEKGDIDKAKLRALVSTVIEEGVHGIIMNGSTGEFYTMTPSEMAVVLQEAIDEAKGRVPVLSGTSSSSTAVAIELGKMAADLGADGVMMLPPYYALPNEREILHHYETFAQAVSLPIMLYNGPRRTGVFLTPSLVERLADIDWVVAIKDSAHDFHQLSLLMRAVGHRIRIMAGYETLLLPLHALGGDGVVAMSPQILPGVATQLWNALEKGDSKRSRELHMVMVRLYDAFKIGNYYSAIKEAMNLMGRPGGFPRPPLLPLTSNEREQVVAILKELNEVVGPDAP